MPDIPQRLEEWNLDTVWELVSKGFFETDTFDFKEVLIASRNRPDYKKRLTQAACAFANTRGGFLAFGVKDAKAASSAEGRLVGIPNSPELAKEFGEQVSNAEPALNFIPQNPPILVESQEVV